MGNKTLSNKVVATMRENGWLRSEGFALREGFAGKFEILNVRTFKTNDSTKIDNFTLECEAPNGKANLSGYQVANARVIESDEIEVEGVAGKKNIYDRESIKDIIASSVPLHSKFEDNVDYTFEQDLNVVGAMVILDETTKKPLIPMRRYKYYTQVLNHHRKIVEDSKAFMSRQDFRDYLSSEEAITGVPAETKEMVLGGNAKDTDESIWSFTLLVADKKE